MTPPDTLESHLARAVRTRVFPGGVLLAGNRREVLFERAFGRLDYEIGSAAPSATETLYDLASLTKPLATAALAALWFARGELDLDERVGAMLPAAAGRPIGQVRIEHLLAHASGLPDWRPLYKELLGQGMEIPSPRSRDALLELTLQVPLEAEPGVRRRYSDLDYIILGRLLERIGGQRLDVLVDKQLLRPRTADNARYFNLLASAEARSSDAARTAPSESCPWRGRILRAEVHDDNAWTGGGVEGHAGLFAAAGAALSLARLWLDAAHGHGPLAVAAARFLPSGPTLGWDRPSEEGSQGGAHLGPDDFGHLGFTGTSVWIQPAAERIVVLLTNRVHPDREDRGIAETRRLIHDAVHLQLSGGGA